MTLRITRDRDAPSVLKLTGRIRSGELEEIKSEMERAEKIVALDLAEVTLIDLDGVRFLASSEIAGVSIINCSPYIRDWVARERAFLGEKGV